LALFGILAQILKILSALHSLDMLFDLSGLAAVTTCEMPFNPPILSHFGVATSKFPSQVLVKSLIQVNGFAHVILVQTWGVQDIDTMSHASKLKSRTNCPAFL